MTNTNGEKQLEEIYDICSRRYKDMCGNKRADHSVLFSYLRYKI